jgi:hypothetical protein
MKDNAIEGIEEEEQKNKRFYFIFNEVKEFLKQNKELVKEQSDVIYSCWVLTYQQ